MDRSLTYAYKLRASDERKNMKCVRTSQRKRRARQVRKVREFLQESKKNTGVVFFLRE
jgi:hypothetical protein